MPVDRVVVNASPLIVLFKSEQAELLPQLFHKILVPQAVWQEVTAPQDDVASRQLPDSAWAMPVDVAVNSEMQLGIWA
jgi:predicted nucleic acid-binding protein